MARRGLMHHGGETASASTPVPLDAGGRSPSRRAAAAGPAVGVVGAGAAPTRALWDAIDTAVCVADMATGRLWFRNHAASALGAAEPRSVQDVESGFAVSPLQQFTAARLQSAAAEGGPIEGEFVVPASGRAYLVRASLIDWEGQPARLHVYTDVTRRSESARFAQMQQEQLMLTSRLLGVGEMAATLAHELNQPLGVIINYLNVCLRRLDRDDPALVQVMAALHGARAQAEHAAHVIARVREFVRTREPRKESHPVRALMETVLGLLALELRQQRVDSAIDIEAGLPGVVGDRVMIEQVLLNLAKNAIEAMRQTPIAQRRLRLRARLNDERQIEIAVTDHGHGLAGGVDDKLFSPFFSTKPDGMGVGLNICRSIVEYHGGRMLFANEPAGGCTFSFTLPAAVAAASPGERR